jgi:hypothetical protein
MFGGSLDPTGLVRQHGLEFFIFQQILRETKAEPATPPIRDVNKCVEVLFQELQWICFHVAPPSLRAIRLGGPAVVRGLADSPPRSE